jgi:hypothetical protein
LCFFLFYFAASCISLKVACQDVFTIYADGQKINIPNHDDLHTYTKTLNIPDTTHVLALKCEHIGSHGGFLAAETANNLWLNTNNTKCHNADQPNWTDANFDDSAWRPAFSFGYS